MKGVVSIIILLLTVLSCACTTHQYFLTGDSLKLLLMLDPVYTFIDRCDMRHGDPPKLCNAQNR